MSMSLPPHAVRAHRERISDAEQELERASEGYGLLVGLGAPPHRIAAAERRIDKAVRELRALGVITRTAQRESQ